MSEEIQEIVPEPPKRMRGPGKKRNQIDTTRKLF